MIKDYFYATGIGVVHHVVRNLVEQIAKAKVNSHMPSFEKFKVYEQACNEVCEMTIDGISREEMRKYLDGYLTTVLDALNNAEF
jgi:hypothetical protein